MSNYHADSITGAELRAWLIDNGLLVPADVRLASIVAERPCLRLEGSERERQAIRSPHGHPSRFEGPFQ